MRHDRIVPGTILITLGIVFLLNTIGWVHIHWFNIVYLWPLFLLIGGINLIFANNRAPWASALKIGVVILGFGILLFGDLGDRYNFWPRIFYSHHNNNDDDDDSDTTGGRHVVKVEGNSTFQEQYHADAHVAKLSISGGATNYILSDTTNQLFQGFTKEFNGRYVFSSKKEDSVYVLNFEMKNGNQHFDFGRHKDNTATFKLNSAPIWDLDIDAGAANINFDLTKFKIRNIDLNGGAASVSFKLGQPLSDTKIDVNAGAANVKIAIPKDAACRVESETALTSTHFEGMTKVNDGYETPGYSSAKNKINVSFQGGMADFSVTRY